MTPKEAFKIGFLQKCAADGLSPAQTMLRIQHAKFMLKAGSAITKSAGPMASGLGAAWDATKKLGLLYMLAPLALGGLGGYGIAKLQDSTYDAGEARKREEISEYGRALQQLQRVRQRQQAYPGM